jgi:transposase
MSEPTDRKPPARRLVQTGVGRPIGPGSLVRPLASLGLRSLAAAKLERLPGPGSPEPVSKSPSSLHGKATTMVSIGIDVSKLQLDWAAGPGAPVQRVANDRRGIRALVARLSRLKPDRIVLESTGGYERALLQALADAGLPAVLVNPWRVRRFGEGLGKLAKTDSIDARLLAHFGAVVDLQPTPVRQGRRRLLADLVARRRQLLALIVAEKNRIALAPRVLRREIAGLIEILERRVTRLDQKVDGLLQEDPERSQVGDLLRSVPGVGPGVARTLLVDLPELGALSRREIASLVGVAPFARDSGQKHGLRYTRAGRASPRTALYMASVTGARYNPLLRTLYQRLRAAGKPPKLALIALARKLLTILNAIVRDQKPWRDAHA